MPESIDIAVITVIPSEIEAVFRIFEIDRSADIRRIGSLEYWASSIYSSVNGQYMSVAVTFLKDRAGTVEAGITATLVCEYLSPRLLTLVGIAAGAEGRCRIGDVIIPEVIHDITTKVRKPGGELLPRRRSPKLDGRILSQFKLTPVDAQLLAQRTEIPKNELENLRRLAQAAGLEESDIANPVSLKDGSIASDNLLLRDPDFFPEFMSSNDERIRALEMEAAGFVRACELADIPWLVVRGVSDYGDDRKSDDFQSFAAVNAAICSRQVIADCLDISKFEKGAMGEKEISLFASLEASLVEAYSAKQWEFAIKIGNFLSRPLWLSGLYSHRLRIGRLLEDAAAHHGDRSARARALIDDVGWTAYAMGQKEQAVKSISDGVLIAEKASDWYVCTKGSRHLASISRRSGDLAQCSIHLDAAENFSEKIEAEDKKRELQISLMLSRAKCLVAEEKADEAISWARAAEGEMLKVGDSFRVVKIFQVLGEAEFKKGNSEAALENYRIGYERAYSIGRRDEALANAVSFAVTCRSTGQAELANEWATRALSIASGIGAEAVDKRIIEILVADPI